MNFSKQKLCSDTNNNNVIMDTSSVSGHASTEDSETAAALLRLDYTVKRPSNKCTKRCCALISLGVVLVLVLMVVVVVVFQRLRCGVSGVMSLGLLECEQLNVLDDEFNTTALDHINTTAFNTLQLKQIELIEHTWEKAWEIFHDTEGWTNVKGNNGKTGRVDTKSYEGLGKVYRLQAYIDMSPQHLVKVLSSKTTEDESWNPMIEDVKILETLTDNIDIKYTVSAPIAGGLISTRDAVSVRHWKSRDNMTMICTAATTYPDMPLQPGLTRTSIALGATLYSPVPGKPDQCLWQWASSTGFGGWIPQWLVQKQTPVSMMDYLQTVRDRIEYLNSKKSTSTR